ncbi:helix-turn-helix domain-containing protein [Acinetobacter bereziniae]|uniref:LexA family protein n=1 Tax=Acinetobacter bereziniae TaxID=106648 RepID=UPI001901FFC7|nr:XRE family transcriptional regulator [Acinetobacter bereziniae]MBJ8450300.1 helix-turn-helix domain-containing protein [Acinetobacter bereziniae]MBJ8454665.1 helix-turn-helix domain-containing protein [Acinetobacter bereziniae]
MEKQSAGQRIRALRRSKKLTQVQLAKIAGVSSPAVTEWEKDSYLPKAASLEAMANEFGVTTEYILTGKGGEPINEHNVAPITPKMAPVLSWVQAGVFTNVEAIDMSRVEEWLPLPDDCDKCFYLKVQGLSNYPVFEEGDYILVDPTVQYDEMQSGDVIVVRKHDEATFKRLVIETDNSRYLQAINPEFKPNIIPLDEECIFVGEVIDSVRYVFKSKRRSKIRKS